MPTTLFEAELVYAFGPTIPHGTAIDAPYSTGLSFPPARVVAVGWKVPPGPRGFMGWALGASGDQLIPSNSGAFIVTDNEEDVWNLTEQVTTGDFTFIGYNTGLNDHSVYLRFLCVPLKGTPIFEPFYIESVPDNAFDGPNAQLIAHDVFGSFAPDTSNPAMSRP